MLARFRHRHPECHHWALLPTGHISSSPTAPTRTQWGVVRTGLPGRLYYDLTKSRWRAMWASRTWKSCAGPIRHDPGRWGGLAEEAKRLHTETNFAIAPNMPCRRDRDAGAVHARLRGLRLADLELADPVFYHALMERITDLWIEMARDELDAVGNNVDLCFFGDLMLAFQDRPMMSMDLYRNRVKSPLQAGSFRTSSPEPRPRCSTTVADP